MRPERLRRLANSFQFRWRPGLLIAGRRFDRDIGIDLDGNAVVGGVDNDLVITARVDDFDGLICGFVIELQLVTTLGDDLDLPTTGFIKWKMGTSCRTFINVRLLTSADNPCNTGVGHTQISGNFSTGITQLSSRFQRDRTAGFNDIPAAAAYNVSAKQYYEQFGFIFMHDHPLEHFL